MTTAKPRAAAAVVAATMLACCSSAPSPTADLGREPAGKISVDGMYTHLGKLQEIADANKRTHNVHILGTILGADVGVCGVASVIHSAAADRVAACVHSCEHIEAFTTGLSTHPT